MTLHRAGRLALGLALLALPLSAPARQPRPARPPALRLGKTDRILTRHPGGASGLAISPDGKVVASAGGDNMVCLTDTATGKELRRWGAHSTFTRCVTFSPDGKVLATGSNDKEIILWDPATGKELRRLAGHAGGMYKIGFTPDSKTVLSGGFDEHIRVWDLATGKEKWSARAQRRVVYALAVAPDGKTLATGGDNEGTLRLWDLATGKQFRSWSAHSRCVYAAAFSPDGKVLATGGGEGVARLWDVATGKEVRRLGGHDTSGVYRVVFGRDGRTLATASYQRQVHLWELASGKEIYRFGDHGGWVWNLAYSRDGHFLVSASGDTTVVFWDLAGRARRLKAPTPAELDGLWRDLGGANPTRAYEAVRTLAGAAEQAVPLVRDRLRPAKAKVDAARIARLIAELDDDEFAVRERASAELDRLGLEAVPAWRRALAKKPGAELRRRLEELLRKHDKAGAPADQLRTIRAVAVLELAGTRQARRVLQKLAGGPDALLAQQARSALDRLGRRP
jgi:dipeptidyl aminopeptidase/acylaminoacyl peptidase